MTFKGFTTIFLVISWGGLEFWESALFSDKYIWLKFHQNRRDLDFQGGRSPLLAGGYM